MMKKRYDWKGYAAFATALLAVLGFFWNKAEGCMDRQQTNAVQQASYDQLAKRLDEVYVKVAVMEKMVDTIPILHHKLGMALPEGSLGKPVVKWTPPGTFEHAQLPSFQKLREDVEEQQKK